LTQTRIQFGVPGAVVGVTGAVVSVTGVVVLAFFALGGALAFLALLANNVEDNVGGMASGIPGQRLASSISWILM
jgi:hypothetical protein